MAIYLISLLLAVGLAMAMRRSRIWRSHARSLAEDLRLTDEERRRLEAELQEANDRVVSLELQRETLSSSLTKALAKGRRSETSNGDEPPWLQEAMRM